MLGMRMGTTHVRLLVVNRRIGMIGHGHGGRVVDLAGLLIVFGGSFAV